MKQHHLFLTFLVTTVAALNTHAQNLLTNGSFESPGVPNGGYILLPSGSTSITGWTVTHQGLEWYEPRNYQNFGVAHDGAAAVDLACCNNDPPGGVEQSFATVPGASYEVSLWAGTLKRLGRDGTAYISATAGNTTTNIYVHTESSFIDWSRHRFSFIATNAVTTLSFTTTNNDYHQFPIVDDVAVFALDTNITARLSIEFYPGIRITGIVGQSYRIDYTEKLATTNWTPLTFITLPTSPYLFFDVSSPRSTNRFYRAEQIFGGQ